MRAAWSENNREEREKKWRGRSVGNESLLKASPRNLYLERKKAGLLIKKRKTEMRSKRKGERKIRG